MKTRCIFALMALVGIVAPGTNAAPSDGDRRPPNIVFILADDLGYGDVGCYGCPDIRTPAIDRLAREGVRFTSFYSNGPECTPTRTALMTGRYQQRAPGMECAIGLGNVGRYDDAERLASVGRLGLPPEQNILAAGLSEAGYATFACGKWHLGYDAPFSPRRHGFDRYFGPLGGAVDYFYHCEPDGTAMLYEDDRPISREGYLTDLITETAKDWVRDRPPGRPFFLYVAYTAPHTPIQSPGPKPPARCTEEVWNLGDRPTYAAMVESMDRGIEELLDVLRQEQLEQDTLVIFCSDNGATKLGRNAPYSGTKGGLFEGGIRVPCVVRWPEVLPPSSVTEQPALTMDLTRSILRAAGVPPSKLEELDGIDILRLIEDKAPFRHRTLFWRQRRGTLTWRAVRDGALKYIEREDDAQRVEYLFDLQDDPQESRNLRADRPDEAARLHVLLRRWEQDVTNPQ